MTFQVETAESIARTRRVSAQALFEGRADLNNYPFQLLAVTTANGNALDQMSTALAAAEYLMPYGWELVSISHPMQASHPAAAIMRRVPQPR